MIAVKHNPLKTQILQFANGSILERELVVIRMDGGISSQIAFWALGYELELHGLNVKYDLSWFGENGLDADRKQVRNFDFCKALPNLKIAEASNSQIFISKKLQNFKHGNPLNIIPPIYLNGYFGERWNCILKHRVILSKNFKPAQENFEAHDRETLMQILKSKNSCGIHVRRGDLANGHKQYGKAISSTYFLKAIKTILEINPLTTFFFFSDDTRWVDLNIVPYLSEKIAFKVVKGNGSSKGFMDLYLMSQCSSLISSQGAFGKMARVLGADPTRLIIEPSSKHDFSKNDENVIILKN